MCLYKDNVKSIFTHPNFRRGNKKKLEFIKKRRISREDVINKLRLETNLLNQFIQAKEKKIKELEININEIKAANKTIKSRLEEARSILVFNIKNACKFSIFQYLLCGENCFAKKVANVIDNVFKSDSIDWNRLVSYKGIYINLDAIHEMLQFLGKTDILCGQRVRIYLSTLTIPSNPFFKSIIEQMPTVLENTFLNNNVKSFDYQIVLEHFYRLYEKFNSIKSLRESRTFHMFFPDPDREKMTKNSVEAVYNISVEQDLFSDISSVNTYKLFFKDKRN